MKTNLVYFRKLILLTFTTARRHKLSIMNPKRNEINYKFLFLFIFFEFGNSAILEAGKIFGTRLNN